MSIILTEFFIIYLDFIIIYENTVTTVLSQVVYLPSTIFLKRILQKKSLTQDELIALLKNRNEGGFNYLYDNYSAALYGVILRIVIFKDDADEVLQDVFVKIWNSSAQYDSSKGTLYTWMLNIARNSAIDKLKSKTFQNNLKNQSIPDFVNNHRSLSVDQPDHFHEIQNVVNRLKDDFKDIINKSYFEGFTQQEISDKMNIPLGTVKTRTRAAFAELRELLKEFKL